jgi:multidrug efflux pump subunit AcrA (membrane-fusion protein)
MVVRGMSRAFGLCLIGTGLGWAQALPTSATIESVPLELTMPERYHVSSVLEPVRRVALVAPADGVVRSLDARPGLTVRESQELAQLDRSEATARLKMAQAEVKEKQAVVKVTTGAAVQQEVATAQLEAAEARAELAQLELDRLTLRAPFAGRILSAPVSAAQFVLKGTVIAELADITSLKALVPVDRRGVKAGTDATVYVEEQEQTAKLQSVLPLLETYAQLRELAAPFASAWIVVPNAGGELEPGLRVRSATLPNTPIATISKGALKKADGGAGSQGSLVQVIRNEYVTNVPVEVLGRVGQDRIQITGALRPTDALIASSSVPLLAGTLVRFAAGASPGVEGTTPNPARQGVEAGISPPARSAAATAPGSATSRPRATSPARPSNRPAPRPGQATGGEGSTPF